ncbi:prolipoprotein diacylglyceryl transferase, partial [Pelagibacteraceae bacterium]|nr:prolipoprotein diacylglyceryl transferase [Pelagibacteraceae bacterium]
VANFINAELYGKPTDLFFSVIFLSVDNISRHPSQLYEAVLEGFVLFIILINISLKKRFETGICSCLFLVLYGIFRIISEQFREPDIHIGYLFEKISMGSFLSLMMILIGTFWFINIKKNAFK